MNKYKLLILLPFFFITGWTKILIVPMEHKISVDSVPYTISTDKFPKCDPKWEIITANNDDGVRASEKNGNATKLNKSFLDSYIKVWNDEDFKAKNRPPIATTPSEDKTNIINVMLNAKIMLVVIEEEITIDPSNKDLQDEKIRLQNIYSSYKLKLKTVK